MRFLCALAFARLVRVEETATANAVQAGPDNDDQCLAAGGVCLENADRHCYQDAAFGARVLPEKCSGGKARKCCVPPRASAAPQCVAPAGRCQRTSAPCRGRFEDRLCPGMPLDVKCCVDPGVVPEPSDLPSPLLFVGDSQSQSAVEWTLGPRVAKALRAEGLDATAVGYPGWQVASYLGKGWRQGKPGKIHRLLAQNAYRVLVVQLGVNDAKSYDCRKSFHQTRYTALLEAFVAAARAAGVERIVWVGPAYVDDAEYEARRAALAGVQKQVLEALDVEWLDQAPLTEGIPRRDGLHYSIPNYGRWADKLLGPLRIALGLS